MAEHLPTRAHETPPPGPDRRKLILLSLAAVAMALPVRAQSEKKPFAAEELDQMLAPIALYPDALLSQILMAAGYPLEIVEAARWVQANPNAKGDAAVKAVADKGWDVSVKSLVAFPPVLAQLNEHLDWTQKIGDALIGQQQDVASSIQRLRAKATEAGTLKSGKEQTVSAESQGGETVYAIQPTDPETVYVPSYDPNSAYGQWPNSSYPPTYYPPAGGVLLRGLAWGVGFAAAGAMFGGWNWGGNNGNNYVNVNVNRAVNIDRNFNSGNVGQGGRWQHQVDHRKGVAYRDNATRPAVQTEPSGRRPASAIPRPGRSGCTAGRRGWCRAARGAPGGPGGAGGAGNRPGGAGGVGGAGGGQARPSAQPRGPSGGGGLSGVDRGQQVNRESQRGQAQRQRAAHAAGEWRRRPRWRRRRRRRWRWRRWRPRRAAVVAVAVAVAAPERAVAAVAVEDVDEQFHSPRIPGDRARQSVLRRGTGANPAIARLSDSRSGSRRPHRRHP